MSTTSRRVDRPASSGDVDRRPGIGGVVRGRPPAGGGLGGLAIGAVAVGVARDAARGLPTALGPAGTVDSLLASTAGLVAAGCAGWLGLVLVVASARVLPSGLGRVAALVGDAVTPPLLRRGLAVALGAGLAFGATPATAGAGTRPTPSPAPTSTSTSVPTVVLDRPAAPPAPRAPSRDATVTVRPGDSLWSIAARALGPAATDRSVARAWPAWWAANRTAVGPDPDLILPGQRLTPPDPSAHLETR